MSRVSVACLVAFCVVMLNLWLTGLLHPKPKRKPLTFAMQASVKAAQLRQQPAVKVSQTERNDIPRRSAK